MKTVTILSGKGGVGKSSVTASLALLFSKERHIVVADCDVDTPNLGLVFGMKDEDFSTWEEIKTKEKAEIDPEKCTGCGKCVEACNFSAITFNEEKEIPEINRFLCEGCGTCQLVCPENAITLHKVQNAEVGEGETKYGFKIVSGQLKMGEAGSGDIVTEVKKRAEQLGKEDGDLLIVDAAAGIGCPVIASIRGSDFVVGVVEPTPAALRDLKRALEVVDYFDVPAGILINKWTLNKTFSREIEKFAERKGLTILGKISYSKDFIKSLVKMKPVVEGDEKWESKFKEVADKINIELEKLNEGK